MSCRATGFRVLVCCLSLGAWPSHADVVRVAVASNFAGPLREIAAHFESRTGHAVRVSAASTGKLYAQISGGAPFDVFLAADEARPAGLLDEGMATEVRVYAIGRLAVVSADPALKDEDCIRSLLGADAPVVAIANPNTAPYGKAASAWLARTAPRADMRLVRGDNVAQALSFVATGNARFGIVALSQLRPVRDGWGGCVTELPPGSYPPVRQAVALLAPRQTGVAAAAFFDYLFLDAAAATVSAWDYSAAAGD